MSIWIRRLAISLATLGLLSFAFACGGKQAKEADEPQLANTDEDDAAPAEESDDELMPPEKFDEINRYLQRKNKFLTPCFSKGIEAKEISARGKARISITMTITTEGKIKSPKVTAMQPDSPTLRSCIFDMMTRWTVTTLPKPLEYSHTFGFDSL